MEDIFHYRSDCTSFQIRMLKKSFGIADVTIFIKQKQCRKDICRQEDIGILADELSNLLNDCQMEEILKY